MQVSPQRSMSYGLSVQTTFISLHMLALCGIGGKSLLSRKQLAISQGAGHAGKEKQKQVLVINSPFVWTKKPLKSHRSGKWGKRRTDLCRISGDCSPFSLKIRTIMRIYNKGSRCIFTLLWFLSERGQSLAGSALVTIRAAMQLGWALCRFTERRIMLLGSTGFRDLKSGREKRQRHNQGDAKKKTKPYRPILTLTVHRGASSDNASEPFSCWPYSLFQVFALRQRFSTVVPGSAATGNLF